LTLEFVAALFGRDPCAYTYLSEKRRYGPNGATRFWRHAGKRFVSDTLGTEGVQLRIYLSRFSTRASNYFYG
jgi:hypothetical protein